MSSTKKLVKADPKELALKQKKSVLEVHSIANEHIDKNFIARIQSLGTSWRFVFSWLLLATMIVWVLAIQTRALRSYYTEVRPSEGGTYVEGVVGPLTNLNPIYATTPADQAVSRLLFSSLFKYDVDNNLVGDLAESITSDEGASSFTVKLRENLAWHDGSPLDADDILFTVQTIKEPKARSALRGSWQDIEVFSIDSRTIEFKLPGSFSPFKTLLTFGVLPEHLLRDIDPVNLRGSLFNSSEVIGSGPFKLQRIVNVSGSGSDNREQKIQLLANEGHHLGAPRLDAFTFWIAPDRDRLTDLFAEGQLNGASEIDIEDVDVDGLNVQEKVFSLNSGVYLFYKTTSELLSDKELRLAVSQAIDKSDAARSLMRPVQLIDGPLLPEQVGYDETITQVDTDVAAATSKLDELGWVLGADGVREKDGQRLELFITTERDTDYEALAAALVDQLAKVGITVNLDIRDREGFTENVLQNHVYSDMLLYGINIGSDPDVFAYWHSSQADLNSPVRLNLSEYESEQADAALEGGRSRVDPVVRADKYKDFLSAWVADAPALAVYRPQYTYYELKDISGPSGQFLVGQVDRFRDVSSWTVLTDRVPYDEEN
ncbi:MAG: peptide ABC transporter substrate-binding protein [Patescibacteria group bacterium]